jgi:hypothetical protein
MHAERRTHRSEIRHEALRLALAATAARVGASAALLASEDGLLVAGAGAGFDLDVLAAFAPIEDCDDARLDRATGGRPLVASRIRVGRERLVFATVGGDRRVVDHVEATAARILGAA